MVWLCLAVSGFKRLGVVSSLLEGTSLLFEDYPKLYVLQGDNKVSLWKENLDGSWKNLSAFTDADQDEGGKM
jgi:hypothetical protein